MMQRKNKPKQQSSGGGYGSGYEGSNTTDSLNNSGHVRNKSDADSGLNSTSSSPSKQSKPSPHNAPSSSSGISIAALTGHKPTPNLTTTSQVKGHVKSKVSIATVKRSKCGTQPFDKHWLNVDCCGLICAFFTYCLHAYGIYAFCWVLLPPWFSVMDEDGYREVSYLYFGGVFVGSGG